MDAIGYVASFGMGITLGLMGGGGSILTVPIMVYLFHIAPSTATGYSLFVVGITALVGASMYIFRGEIDFKVGLSFAIPSVVGVNVSRALIIPKIPQILISAGEFVLTKEVLIMGAFASLMLLASYSMIRKRLPAKPKNATPLMKVLSIGAQGLLVGVIAGFVGAGGGFLIIPALVLLAKLPMRVAIGTSLMIIATQSLVGFGGDVLRGATVNWTLLISVAAIAIVGIIAGSSFAHKIKEQKLKIAFGWFVLIMGTSILLEQARHLSPK